MPNDSTVAVHVSKAIVGAANGGSSSTGPVSIAGCLSGGRVCINSRVALSSVPWIQTVEAWIADSSGILRTSVSWAGTGGEGWYGPCSERASGSGVGEQGGYWVGIFKKNRMELGGGIEYGVGIWKGMLISIPDYLPSTGG